MKRFRDPCGVGCWLRMGWASSVLLILPHSAIAGGPSATVMIDHPMIVPQGTSEAALVTLSMVGPPVGLFGYSISIEAVPREATVGTISFDVESLIDLEATNLYLDQNLIAAYPAPLDPFFTVVWPDGPSGVFISANIDLLDRRAPDFVTLTPGLNDVLAEIVVEPSPDAQGVFDLVFGASTVLGDVEGVAVPALFVGTTVLAVPTPDLNHDGFVNAPDLAILLGNWGPCGGPCADFDGDGFVNAVDLSILLGEWAG